MSNTRMEALKERILYGELCTEMVGFGENIWWKHTADTSKPYQPCHTFGKMVRVRYTTAEGLQHDENFHGTMAAAHIGWGAGLPFEYKIVGDEP